MNPRIRLLLAVFAVLCPLTSAMVPSPDDAPNGPRIEIPLDEGRLDVRLVLRHAYAALAIEAPDDLNELVWTIDADSALGRARLESLRRRTDGLIASTVEDNRLHVRIRCASSREITDEDRMAMKSRLDRLTAALRLQRKPLYGLTFVTEGEPRMIPARFARSRETMPQRIVLLVHGLDDPGWLWRDVIGALHEAGHVVARLDYPNDGPIADAADLLMQSLLELKAWGVPGVDIVAHSMGGLIARDVLTRSAYYDGDGRGDASCPAIERLIMCGTPHHGSSMARLRAVAGIGEQLSRLFSNANGRLDPTGLADGAGEAAVDLMPGSAFLNDLNRRPLATHTEYTIIAGRISPVTEDQVRQMGRDVREAAAAAGAPTWLRDWLARAEDESNDLLAGAVRGLGDGCVTIDSARLPGVEDFIVVEANHVGLIVNLSPADALAPAVPIILDRLGAAPGPAQPSASER